MYLNTDHGEYLLELFANGVPASSVRTREIQPSVRAPFRDRLIQYYDTHYEKFLLSEKNRILYSTDPSLYHRSLLDKVDEQQYVRELGNAGILMGSDIFSHCMNTPVDMAICRKHEDGGYYIDFVHLAFPNGWGANEAIGKPFSYFHSEVKNSADKNVVPDNNKFPEFFAKSGKAFERVGAFSLRPSHTLNRHPLFYTSECFDPIANVFVRFERQVVWSLPNLDSFIFIIHTHHVDVRSNPFFFLNAFKNCSENSHTMYHRLLQSGDSIFKYLGDYLNGRKE